MEYNKRIKYHNDFARFTDFIFSWKGVVATMVLIFLIVSAIEGYKNFIDVAGKPQEFQINCNVNNTHCRVSFEDTHGLEYGLMAENYAPDGNAFDYTFSKGNCTILKTYDMENYGAPEEWRYAPLGDMQVKYSYEAVCYSMGKLSLKELLPK